MNLNYINRKYVFPWQFGIGVVGNLLNLLVLNGRGMRTKTNCFLSAMAISDLCFFCVMFPVYLSLMDEVVLFNVDQQRVYFYSHITLIAFANWFSATSIWLTVGVTVERLIAIKAPLLARTYWKKRHVIIVIVLLYVAALLLTCYHFAWRTVVEQPHNNSNGLHWSWKEVGSNNSVQYWYVHVSHGLSAVLVVLVPLLLLILLNCSLVYHLRLNLRAVRNLRSGGTPMRRSERRVTWMIVVLIAAFVGLTVPSGIFGIIQLVVIQLGQDRIRRMAWYQDMSEITNMLVCTGKTVNFWLYCGASTGFRKKLFHVITRRRFHRTVVCTLSSKLSNSTTSTVPRETVKPERWVVRYNNGHVSLQRRTQSVDVAITANTRTPSSPVVRQRQSWFPLRYRTCSVAL